MTDQGPLVEHWLDVGDPPPEDLGTARVLVRELAALVGAVHDTTRGLEWLEEEGALASGLLHDHREPFRVAARPGDPSLVLLDLHGTVLATCPLDGRRLSEAAEWLAAHLAERGLTVELPAVSYRDVVESAHRPALFELGRWLANADRILRNVARHTEGASPVRFEAARGELSTRMTLSARSGEEPRVVEVGLSCGDASVAEPYFFARPSPVDALGQLPVLPEGARWVREPGLEAVMPCSAVARDRDPSAQAGRVAAFVEAAVPAAHGLVHRPWARK